MHIFTMLTRRSRITLGLSCITAALVGLTGCAANQSPASGSTERTQEASNEALDAERDAYDLKLAECLRNAGFDVKDPQPGQGIQDNGLDISAAAAACRGEIGDPPTAILSAEDDAAIQSTYLEWARCFRELGYDVADPAEDEAFAIPADATGDQIAQCTTVTP